MCIKPPTHPLISAFLMSDLMIPPMHMHESVNMMKQSCDSSGIQNLSRIIFESLIILNILILIILLE